MSRLEDDRISPGREIPNHQEKLFATTWIAGRTKSASSCAIEHDLGEHPELMRVLSEAWSGSGLFMQCVKSLVLKLLGYGGRTQRPQNKDILCIFDVISVLPGYSITPTALYKVTEAMTLQHADALVVPLPLLRGAEINSCRTTEYVFRTWHGRAHEIILSHSAPI